MRAVVIGQSHTHAIRQAADEPPLRVGVEIYRLGDKGEKGDQTIRLEDAVRTVRELEPEVPVFISILGTYHNIFGLIQAGPEYDFLLGTKDESVSHLGPMCVPHRVLAGIFREQFDSNVAVARLQEAAHPPLHILSSPPPKQNTEFMTQKMMRKGGDYRGRSFAQAGFSRPDLRAKLWKLETQLLAAWAQERGMNFIPAPKAAFNVDGFLSRKYYFDDVTHANARYGALVLDQIEQCVAKSGAREAVNG